MEAAAARRSQRAVHEGQENQGHVGIQAKEAHLFQQIGKLEMKLEWLKKNLSCSDAHELRKLVDHDHPELSVSRQCALLCLPPSTLYYRSVPCVNPRCGSWPGACDHGHPPCPDHRLQGQASGGQRRSGYCQSDVSSAPRCGDCQER